MTAVHPPPQPPVGRDPHSEQGTHDPLVEHGGGRRGQQVADDEGGTGSIERSEHGGYRVSPAGVCRESLRHVMIHHVPGVAAEILGDAEGRDVPWQHIRAAER